MFGYITADPGAMTPEEETRYRACYCGLCHALKKRHGFLGRMTLTYDMTFLVLVLSSMYEPEEKAASFRCPVHPIKKRTDFQNEFTDYAADMNLLLCWWNCLDDWEDDRKYSRLLLYKALSPKCRKLEQQYPRQSGAIRQNLSELHHYEAGAEVSADKAAECFGKLMGELFVPRPEDYWAPVLRNMGESLGKFIYILDACMDAEADKRKGNPNPLLALETERTPEADRDLLTMLLGDCTAAFEHLPLEQDIHLLRNILYSGVWQRYNHFRKGGVHKEEGETHT